ncbi:MAG: hypothetical protein MZU97_24525 [Bacillus subtilis]|nr:hypothetical protein [Bacillus subtilis]
MGWTSYWSEFPELTSNYNAGKVMLDIAKVGAPEFWGIQLKYKGGAIVQDVTYVLSFQVYSASRLQDPICKSRTMRSMWFTKRSKPI